jgi:DNA topoisomerase-1
MVKNLVIVESPAKAKTISKFLGKNYKVEASMGHIRDLPDKKSNLTSMQKSLPYATLGVDVENDFNPLYVVSEEKKKTIKKLKSFLDKDTKLYIATDEDREGEAIGWHLVEVLNPQKTNIVERIVFHEITKEAILHALETPRQIDLNLVDAQQARRILDRLVGYKLSPLLWKKVRKGLSAGRVQSVAVRLIVDREKEIRTFTPEESWSITALLKKDNGEMFEATLLKVNDKKIVLKKEKEAREILAELKGGVYSVVNIVQKEVKRNPAPPFITSTLQQEAARKLGFSVKKTMMVAQRLYEGKSLRGGEETGLITYMRTDSLNLANKALNDAKKTIIDLYGKEYALEKPRVFKTKAKGAQEAHEAIRPTEISRTPASIENDLEIDEFKLYELIWKRTVATQMASATMDSVSVDILAKSNSARKYIFRASGQTIKFPGFMKLYIESSDHPEKESEHKEKLLPVLHKKELLNLEKITPNQHFTKPPPRYTEASLVKKLESEGIGRPSTYAPTITTIIQRGYIEKEGKALTPTDIAFIVNDLLVKHFSRIVDLKFTAHMEQDLDDIAEGKKKWVPILRDFYNPFAELILEKDKEIKRSEVITEQTEEVCEKCGRPMVIKLGRMGKFLSCMGYPTCKNAKPLKDEQAEQQLQAMQEKFKDEKCEKCGGQMIVKMGRFGRFLACENYPDCKSTKPIQVSLEIKCPRCQKGEIVERKSKKGKIFYGCNQFPNCDFALWKKPVKDPCQKCGGIQVIAKKGVIKCEGCGEEHEEKAQNL